MIRLVALDLDGTILEQGRVISPEVIAALGALDAAGVRCATATGRPFQFQVDLFARHGLGTDGRGGLFPHALTVDEREIYVLDARGRTYAAHRPWNDAVRARWETLHPAAMGWLAKARQEATERGWQSSLPFSADQMYRRGLPTIAFGSPGDAAAIQDWLAERLAAHDVALACNRNVRLVQIHDALVGKGLVLAELARLWGLAPAQVLAIGDSANDFSMLDGRFGFQCATTGNADEAVKETVRRAGGYVAHARVGAGVIEVLRHHAGTLGTLEFATPAAEPGATK